DALDRVPHLDGGYNANAGVRAPTPLWLFDKAGVLTKLRIDELTVKFWCENDGGLQYRPEVRVHVSKSSLARPLAPVADLQNVAAFVIAQKEVKHGVPPATAPDNAGLTGDADGDGKPDAYVWSHPASGCDGKPANGQVTTLRVGKNDTA